MPGKRKYMLNSLPEEAKSLLTLEEKILFDQPLETLSQEDQKIALKARSKVSRYMISTQVVKIPKMSRLDYQEIPVCIWRIMANRFEPGIPDVKTLLQTPPRKLSMDKKNQRLMLATALRQLIHDFYSGCEFFNLDRVLDSTWILMETEYSNCKIVLETLSTSEADCIMRSTMLKRLFNLYKQQPRSVLISSFRVNNMPCTLIRSIKTFSTKTHG